jgi:hypothetical protein
MQSAYVMVPVTWQLRSIVNVPEGSCGGVIIPYEKVQLPRVSAPLDEMLIGQKKAFPALKKLKTACYVPTSMDGEQAGSFGAD